MRRSPRRRLGLVGSTLTLTAMSLGGFGRRSGESRRAPTAPPHAATRPDDGDEPADRPSRVPVVDPAELARAVRLVAEDRIEVDRPVWSRLLARPMQLAGAGQWVPVRREGVLAGYMIAALRQGSLLHELGFQEGDSVLAVAGTPAWRPALLLAVAPSLALADEVVVTVLRGRRQREVVFAVI